MQEWTLTRVRPTARQRVRQQPPLPRVGAGQLPLQQHHRLPGHQAVQDRRGRLRASSASRSSRCCSRPTRTSGPVAMQFGPDGALYVVDWFNPLIGHMQYSLRDPRRDKTHGRVWRITAKGRPLLTPPKIDGATIAAAARPAEGLRGSDALPGAAARCASGRPPRCSPAVQRWIDGLDHGRSADYEHHLLEALWVHEHHDVVEPAAAEAAARGEGVPRPRRGGARAAALVRSRRRRDGAARADGPRRGAARPARSGARAQLRADRRRGGGGAAACSRKPMDYYLQYVLDSTMTTLEPVWKPRAHERRAVRRRTTRPASPSCSIASSRASWRR